MCVQYVQRGSLISIAVLRACSSLIRFPLNKVKKFCWLTLLVPSSGCASKSLGAASEAFGNSSSRGRNSGFKCLEVSTAGCLTLADFL